MKLKNWLIVAAGLIVCGCSSTPKIERIPNSADSREELRRLQQDLTDAQQSQTDALAPKSWREATYYYNQSKSRLADQESKDRVLYSVAESRAWLKKAQGEADQANSVMPDLLEVRTQALEAQAPKFASDEWSTAETYFRRLTRDREGTTVGVSDANRRQIQDLYKKARVKGLQNMYLGDARAAIHDAKDQRAQTLLPNLYTDTMRSLKNAEAYIAANDRDMDSIEQHVNKATADAKRLLRVSKEALAAKGATTEQEAVALDNANQRNRSLAGALDQQAFDQKFEEAHQMFNGSEAEVYKQGDHLLIRLKGTAFPFGSSSLPPQSYPLISKVGTVIKNFNDPRVRIEGHTDSIGGKAFNEQLSQARAETVKTYLISNAGIRPDLIEVVGMGFSRPIASNRSAEGREQNRRVDVIVMPQVQPGVPQIRQAQ